MALTQPWSIGLAQACTPHHLLLAAAGVALGTLSGLLDGLAPVALIAVALPLLYGEPPVDTLIVVAALLAAAPSGTAIASVLARPPRAGGAESAALDGHSLARQGRAAAALVGAGLACAVGGALALAVVALAVAALAPMAAPWEPPAMVALLLLALTASVVLSGGSLIKALAMALTGWLMAQGSPAAYPALVRGLGAATPDLSTPWGLVLAAVGVWGLGDAVVRLARPDEPRDVWMRGSRRRWPRWRDLRPVWAAMLRASALGTLLGGLPDGGVARAARAAYALERRWPALAGERMFGRGNLRGVAAAPSADGAAARMAFVPLLAWGVPVNTATALVLGTVVLDGQPLQAVLAGANASIGWTLLGSMAVVAAILPVLCLPLAAGWARVLAVPRRWVLVAVVLAACWGVYLVHRDPMDLYMVGGFAVLGYVWHLLHCDPAPWLVGFVLGPRIEAQARAALVASGGDWTSLWTHPAAALLLACAVGLVLAVLTLPSLAAWRRVGTDED